MNEKLIEFYSVLQEKNFKLPEYDVFAKELEDPAKSYALYDLLGRKKFKLPEYDVFINELGLKKKGEPSIPGWENIKDMSKTFSTIAGDIPKLEEKEEKVEGIEEKPIESKPSDLKYPHWSNVSKALGIPVSKEIEKIADYYGVKVSELGEPQIIKEAPDTLDEFLGKIEVKKEDTLLDQTKLAIKLKEKPIVNLDDYFRKRNVYPEDVGLPAEVNTERWLSEGEKEKLDNILIDKGLYKPPDYTRKSYAASVAKGFNEGLANMVRDISYLSGLAEEVKKAPLKLVSKITGVDKKAPSETLDKYYEQLLGSAMPSLGASSDDFETIAKFLENLGGDVVPDDRLGEALKNTGRFIPDLLAMTFLPESKIPLLTEYGLRGVLKFPAYLGFKSYVEAAKEGEGVGGATKAGAKGILAGLEYSAIGIEANQLGEIAKSFGAGVFKTETVKALANSLGFAAITKAEGGDVLQGALEGLTFYGLGKVKDIPRDIAESLNRRVFNSYLTATDNNIRNVAQMRKDFDPFKARQESVDLWRQYMEEKDPAKQESIIRKKNVVDNIININAATNLVLKYPDKFINIIKDSPLLSEREKNVWIKRISRTIEDADPRIQEAKPIREELVNLKSELTTWQEDINIGEDVRADKIKAINTRIEELQKNVEKVMAKPLEDYMPKIKPIKITEVEEKPPEIPIEEEAPMEVKKETPPAEKAEGKKKGKLFGMPLRLYNAKERVPDDITDVILQHFMRSGTVNRQQFIDESGWSEADIKESGIEKFLKEGGQAFDTFHENQETTFRVEEKGAMDMGNEIVRVLTSYANARGKINKWTMLEAFEKRHNIVQPFEPTEEEIAKQASDEKFAEIIKENGGLNEKAMEKAAEAGLISKEELDTFKSELENENIEREQSEREIADEEARIAAERRDQGGGKNIPSGEEPGEGKDEPKPEINEEPNKPNPPISKGEENIVPGSTEGNEKPVTPKGEAKPVRTTDVVKQKQIDAINKEYDQAIAKKQKELKSIPKKIQDAIDKANEERVGLFGDNKPIEADEIIKREEQGFTLEGAVERISRPFLQRKAELEKDIKESNTKRENAINTVLYPTLGFEAAPEKPEGEPTLESLNERAKRFGITDRDEGKDIPTKILRWEEEFKSDVERIKKEFGVEAWEKLKADAFKIRQEQLGNAPEVKKLEPKPEAPKKIQVTKEGVKYGDKTYTDIVDVLDDIENGTVKKEDGQSLREAVNKWDEKNKPEGLPQRKEGLGATDRSWRAKNKKAGNEIKTDTKEDAEKMSFNEPLPMTLNEDPNYGASDLNNKLTLAGIGRNLVKNLGRKLGGGVRFGMIKRFMRKAEGIFFPDSGIVRIKGIKDFRTLCHELGHWIDFHIFDMRNVVGAKNLPEKYPDIAAELRTVGVKFKGRIYRDIEKINRDIASGRIKQVKANDLRIKLETQLKARDKRLEPLIKKYGKEVVAGVLQRDYFQKELRDYLIDINYPMSQRKKTEAIAEFIYNYVVDQKSVQRLTPKFHAWFEKLLETAPPIKDALLTAREEFKDYDALDPRAKRFIETKKKEPWLEGLVKSWNPDKWLYSYVNHLQYMKNLSEEWRLITNGNAQSFKDPYISAKAMMGIDGRAQQWLLHHPYFHRGTDFEIKKDVDGLITILKPIIGKKEYGDYSDYLLALDSRESYENQSPQQAVMPLDLAKSKIALYEKQYGVRKLWDFQSKIQAYNESLIDFLVESGKLSREVADLIKSKHHYYTPLKRVFEEFEIRKGAAGTGRDILATSEKAIWKRFGSERNVKDIFASMIENTYNILSAGEHNILNTNVRDALFDIQKYNLAKKIDKSLIQEIPGNVIKPYYDIASGTIRFGIVKEKPIKGKILTVWEDGKPHYYDVDAELYNNLFQHEPKVTAVIRFLSMPSRWLQAGAVVYDPTFPVRNIVRDQISGRFYSKYGYSPADFLEGVFHAVKKDDIFQKWMASGGDQSFLTAADKLLEGKYAERKIGRPLQKKWKTYTKNPLLALQDFSRMSEIGTRLGAFSNAYKKTRDANLAGMESRDISADYGIHGAVIRNILPLYPFLNARLQHTRMMTEVMVKHPARFFMRGMEVTAIGVLNWLVNNQDERSRKLYQSLPAWRRIGMFNIRIPGTDNFLPLPKGFLGILFASSVESALDWAVNDDPRVAEDIALQLFKEYSPVGSVSEIFPHIFKIPMELISNKVGYSNKPIVPESLRLLEKKEQYLDSTPEIFKKIGDWANISPLRITYLTRSLFGGAGIGAVNILDEVLQTAGLLEDKPDDTFTILSRMPFTKAFFTETPIGPYSAQVGDFYETLDKITKLNRTINDYVEKGNFDKINKLMEDPEKERMYVFYEGNGYAINKFREVMSGIRDLKIANIKDDLITKDAARKENGRLDRLIYETAIQFKDAWNNDKSFNLNDEMQKVMDKISKEKGETKEEIGQFKNTYNPYWLQLREKDKGIYDLLREYNGLKDLEPTRKIKDVMTGDNITLKFQNARRFNEEVVSNYAEEVKNVIGDNADSFKVNNYPLEDNPEKTELERLLQIAWERALNTTRNNFKIPEK